MTDGIHPHTLRSARRLSILAYTGLLLLLPAPLAAKYWQRVVAIGDEIIGDAVGMWPATVDIVEEAA